MDALIYLSTKVSIYDSQYCGLNDLNYIVVSAKVTQFGIRQRYKNRGLR
jgi:hypothetical protein